MFFEDWSIDYDLWGDTGAQTFAAAEAAVSALYGGGDADYLSAAAAPTGYSARAATIN